MSGSSRRRVGLAIPTTENSGGASRAPDHARALPCGSASTKSTRLPRMASVAAMLIEMVVFPTPPFWDITPRIIGSPFWKTDSAVLRFHGDTMRTGWLMNGLRLAAMVLASRRSDRQGAVYGSDHP